MKPEKTAPKTACICFQTGALALARGSYNTDGWCNVFEVSKAANTQLQTTERWSDLALLWTEGGQLPLAIPSNLIDDHPRAWPSRSPSASTDRGEKKNSRTVYDK